MPKLRFRGDGDHDVCTVFGLDFPAGKFVHVPDDHLAAGLVDNPMFEAAPQPVKPPKAA